MYLKALELQGFKSFPDKTTLQFGKGMTAVVGPNGSGKSNISDAVRWVLGEQSTKSLRSSKMEDVVFSGTGDRKALGFAEVSLILDNRDRTFDINKDEITVTRRYYRSGESEYKINGEQSRLRDIHELFMDTGLGRDGYSMVSQGRIEELVAAKSDERRDIFEEAAGISHYRYRRGDATKRLDQAEENLVRLRDIMTELEGRVEPLRIQSEKAQKFIVLADERKQLEIGLWLNTLERSADVIREQAKKAEIAQAQYDTVTKELEDIFSGIEGATEKARNITLQIEEIQRAAARFEEQASQLDAIAAVDGNSIEHNLTAIERLEKDKQSEDETEQHLAERIDEARKKIEQLGIKIEENRILSEKAADELLTLKDKDGEDREESNRLSEKLAQLQLNVSRLEIIRSSADSAVEEIKTRLHAIASGEATRAAEIKELSDRQKELEEKHKNCEETITENKNAAAGYTIRVNTKQTATEKHKAECESAKIDIERRNSKIHMLEEMQRNMEGYTGSVKAVVRESKRGTLRGIHGALSMLINTQGEYSVAIETALGAAIQNIVTDSENDAKRAMFYLRDNNLGRATFLPLSAIRGRTLEEKGLDDCYGYVGIASALVSADGKYSEIIKNLLGRTVIVEDIDSAVTMAKKYANRFKIVTLDGQVINAGGSMTGGSKIQNSGFLSRSNEQDKLKDELKKAESKLTEMLAQLKKMTQELALERANLDGAQAELFKAEEEKIKTESALTLTAGQLEALLASEDSLKNEKNTSGARIGELTATIADAGRELETNRTQVGEVEGRLSALGISRESILAQREKLNDTLSEINVSTVAAMKDIDAQKDSITSLLNRRSSHSGRIEELDAEIAAIKLKNGELKLKIENLRSDAEDIRRQGKDSSEITARLAAEREEFEKQVSQQRQSERAKNDEKEKLSGEIARLNEKRDSLVKEQEDIERKLFEEYQLTKREAAALEIEIASVTDATKRLTELRGKIRALGSVNVAAIDEYKEVSERYVFMRDQIADVEKSRDELNKLISELTGKMALRFREQFDKINSEFSRTFAELFGGGKAELKLEDENDILECAIDIIAQPPGKNVKSMMLLSGGEKGLCAISLLFAILKVNPAPFCIFDEVEAALDDVNVTKYAQYVNNMTANTQFILITHRRGTMEAADILYGVTMQERGVSKLLKLQTAEMAKELGLE